jgi:hypothetical protein
MENKFYTAEPEFKQVTRAEYEEFLKNYPRPLRSDVCAICDPPVITHNDFELANRWPYSVIARTWLYDDKPGQYFYEPEEKRKFYICVNYRELFDSKTGYIAD